MPRRLIWPSVAWLACGAAEAFAAGGADAATNVSEQGVKIGAVDLTIIVCYLVGIVALGCWAGIRKRREAQGSDYFLAGKSLRWPIIGLALFATNISTIHLVSLAQCGYTSGLLYGNFEWMAGFTLICLSLFFAPFYIRSKVATLPDFLEKRYNRSCRDWVAVLSIVSAIFIHIGFSLYTGALVLNGLFGINMYLSIISVAVLTGLYTTIGGLLAVVLTESIQTVILLIGAICITLFGLNAMGGGWNAEDGWVQWKVMEGWASLKDHVHPVNYSVMRPGTEPTGLSMWAVLLGYPVIGIWYWCCDQTIVQRVLAAKNEIHARVGPLFAGFIKILPMFIFVLPGLICLGLIEKGVLTQPLTDSKDTYAYLIRNLLPVGLKGLVAAALLAALMSTVSGALNSIATLFSYDIFRRWRPQTSDRSLVLIGRVVTFCAMIAAILWSPHVGQFESIFQGINDLICYIAPPITVVFLWGVFWRRASGTAALITLISGSVLGLAVFAIDWYDVGGWNIHSMISGFGLFLIGSATLVVLSLLFPHRHTQESSALVWRTPLESLRGEAWRGVGNFRFLAAALTVILVALYFLFAGNQSYYPISGRITLADGTPAVGVRLTGDCGDPVFNFSAVTDQEGNYAYATKERAGGAPAGTKYRIKIALEIMSEELAETLAALPSWEVIEVDRQKDARLLINEATGAVIRIEEGELLKILPPTPIPARYGELSTSGLNLTVEKKVNRFDVKLEPAGELLASQRVE